MRFGEAEAADRFALLQQWQPFFFLRVRTERVDRIHHQRRLHRNKAAQAGIAALQFLRHQAVFHVGHARASVALQARAEKAELGHLRHQLHRKFSFAVVFLDDRHDFRIYKLACSIARELFFVAEHGIEVEIINPGERWHGMSP